MKKLAIVLGILILITGLATVNFAADDEHEYAGVAKCKPCHSSDKMGGTQYTIWAETGHAKAFEVLGTDAAKEVAAEAGIEGDPQEADACLKCHVTAWEADKDLRGSSWKEEDGVTCENCHGAGTDYMPMNIMKDGDAAKAKGLLFPDEETCTGCHNEDSPTFVEFNYEEMLEEIKHWE